MAKILSSLLCLIAFYMPAAQAKLDLLPADQLSLLQARVKQNKELEFYWQIASGYYLYQDQVKLINSDNESILDEKLLPPALPQGLYANSLIISIPWDDNFLNNSLILSYQACAANGFCYPPINKLIHINENLSVDIKDTSLDKFTTGSGNDRFVATIRDKYLPLSMLMFFSFGLLLAFTPCVLPMIPLVVNLIIGTNTSSIRKSLLLACCYVAGMAGSYSLIGTLTGMLGASLQIWLQQPLIIILFSVLLLILALMQIGWLKFRIPHANKFLHHWGGQQNSGTFLGAFVLGSISVLLVSPCITPPLIGILTYIGQNGSALIGGLTLFSLGLGMGVPLILVAILSSRILPIAGRWTHLIKALASLALIALALWLLQGIIPVRTPANHGPWQNIDSVAEFNAELAMSVQQQKDSIVEIYAEWCASCRKIETEVLQDMAVQEKLANFNLFRIDITDINTEKKLLLQQLQVYGPPTFLFFDASGTEIKSQRKVGSITQQDFLNPSAK